MNYISANINFIDYVNKFVIVDIEGVNHKFTIKPIDNTLVYPSSAILLNNEYNILGLANIQDCPPCSATFVIWDGVQEQFLSVGDRARLFVTTRGNSAGLVYQWNHNGTNIYGATADNYVIPPVIPLDNGSTYGVGVTGICNTAYSENKIWLSTQQFFATACGIEPTNLFNYNLYDDLYRYNTIAGDLVNGDWINSSYLYKFVNGSVINTTISCTSAHTWDQWVDHTLPPSTTLPPTTTPCPCYDYLFYSECFPPPEDEGFILSYCCGLFYEGFATYTGYGYRNGYRYQFVNGVIQGDGIMCTTTTPPPCSGTVFHHNCGETGGTSTLHKCGPYWYYEPTANVDNLVTGTFSKDGFLYQFASGVIVNITICPSCSTETFYNDCTEGAGTVTYYFKSGLYFLDSESCAAYDSTNPASIPGGLVDGVVKYGANYPGRTEYEFGSGIASVIGNCPLPTTTTPAPECCSTYGYLPAYDSGWGSNYATKEVSCDRGFSTKTCYYYVPPTTTTTSTTTPVPCPTGTISVPSTNTYTFTYDGTGMIDLFYTPYANPLFPIHLGPSTGTPLAVYTTDCVIGGTNLFVTKGCFGIGASCTTPTPTTTTPTPTTTLGP